MHMLRDGALALPACLLIATAHGRVAGLVRRARAAEWWAAGGRVARYGLLFAIAAPAFVLSMQGAEQARALAGPGQPCPTDAPVKHFDVTALDVKIPLNRFGDNDPAGKMYALDEAIPAVRAQEASRQVSIGLRDDAIQPLVIRANLGDCVEITTRTTPPAASTACTSTAWPSTWLLRRRRRPQHRVLRPGGQRAPTVLRAARPALEGTHYLHPGPGYRQAVSHGLFGALAVEPAGSTYLDPTTGLPLKSGWEAMIKPAGKAAFREFVKVYHEIGDENAPHLRRSGRPLPTSTRTPRPTAPGRAPSTTAPSRSCTAWSAPTTRGPPATAPTRSAIPATPMPRGYMGDPTKIRIIHAGWEMFHVFHLHGGGIRWRYNPHADPTWTTPRRA